jgi:hypothetical protein
VVFLKFGFGLAVRYCLPRPCRIEGPSSSLVLNLFCGRSLRLDHLVFAFGRSTRASRNSSGPLRRRCRRWTGTGSPLTQDGWGGNNRSARGFGPALTPPTKVSSPPLQPGGFFFCSCQARARRSAGPSSPAAEVRPVPSAGKIERPTSVRTVFERPWGLCS